MGTLNLAPASTADYRREAERRLPRFLFDYLDGGAYQERTLRENVTAFEQLRLKQQVMRDVSQIDTRTELLSHPATFPAALAPIGLGGMMARRAEVQAKRAADDIGIPFTLSTVAICSIEEIAAVSNQPFWFQLYMLKDRGPVKELLQRARDAGVETLVFTVDLAVLGARYRDVRNGMSGANGLWQRLRGQVISALLHPRWLWDVGLNGKPHTFGSLTAYVPNASRPDDFQSWITQQLDASVTWKDIEWLRSIWPGKLVIKGILSPEDARSAVRAGADALVVSNHGGRQLDGVAPTIEMLPRVVEAIAGHAEIWVDSGVRSGQDIAKALALGADGTLIGRPWVYAVAARGEDGVRKLLNTFRSELRVAMALTGCTDVKALTREILDTSV
ncbi:MAG: L-lactate dehydrogenase [Halieaceae bacterium]|jgi:L-lactate dehydrogenase (cytochrome)|nr:L-lactate dehydrogenase [Halieaceae bacterium]